MQAVGTVSSQQVTLRAASREDLLAMMAWFPDGPSCRIWGGPEFRFPFSEQSFQADSRFEAVPSYVYTTNQTVIAFGQYYLRDGRCHVSRLAVSPTLRGKGWGSRLLCALIELGSAALGVEECSLFVAADNHPAARLYRRLGFVETPYAGPQTALHDILYLTAEIRAVRRHSSVVPET